MNCPWCGALMQTKRVEQFSDQARVYRHRKCSECLQNMETFEVPVAVSEIVVIAREGSEKRPDVAGYHVHKAIKVPGFPVPERMRMRR